MRHLILSIALTLLTTVAVGQNYNGLSAADSVFVDTTVINEMNDEDMVGTSIGIIKDGEVVYLKGYGWEDQELGIPASVNTMYRIASISKTFAATAALQLWEMDSLELTDSVRQYVPEYPVKPQGTMEVQHILANESGIQHYLQVNNYDWVARDYYIINHPDDLDPIASIDVFKNQPILFAPGSQFNYTTFGFNLVAAVVERAGGAPFEDQVRTRISDVADMPFFQVALRGMRPFYNQAAGYRKSSGKVIRDKGGNADYTDVSWKVGGGGWICTVRDLTHFMKAYVNRDLISSATIDTMLANHSPSNGTNYGFGIISTMVNGDTVAYHDGAQAWCRTLIYFSPENKSGVAVMTNNRNTNPYPLAQTIYNQIQNFSVNGNTYVNPIPDTLNASTITQPASGATNVETDVEITWDAVDYAATYELQWSTDASFSNYESIVIRDSNFTTIRNLNQSSAYHCRVRAFNDYAYGGISGPWSSSISFTTGTTAPTLILPFSEDFENMHHVLYGDTVFARGKGFEWHFTGDTNVSRMKSGKWAIHPHSGNGALTMDAMSTNGQVYNTNYVTLTLDLSQYMFSTDLALYFHFSVHGEESHAEDKIWVRGNDTANWIELFDWYANKPADGLWDTISALDIDSVLTAGGQKPSTTFQLRIGQRDNSYISDSTSLDGFTIDNLWVGGTIAANSQEKVEPQVIAYPNPADRKFTISSDVGKGLLQVRNIEGKLMIEKASSARGKISVNCKAWPNGIYLWQIVSDESAASGKIIVRH